VCDQGVAKLLRELTKMAALRAVSTAGEPEQQKLQR
jgi:hypothetical protein